VIESLAAGTEAVESGKLAWESMTMNGVVSGRQSGRPIGSEQ